MNRFETTVRRLQAAVQRRGINYSLDRLTYSLDRLGNPHRTMPPIIHVAGTNGKGSTTAYIAAILRAHGFTVGTYTSPHIRSYCDRIAVDDRPISDTAFSDLFDAVTQQIGVDTCSEFEVLTAMAWMYFNAVRPDYVVVETGLGGRLDATNVVHSLCSVITPVGWDHAEILGPTLAHIAREKAGIVKVGCPLFMAKQTPEVDGVIRREAAHRGVSDIVSVDPWPVLLKSMAMTGDYQRQNAALASAVTQWILGKSYSTTSARAAIATTVVWGRYTQWTRGDQTIVIDGAHNAHGFQALFSGGIQPDTVWLGMLATKQLTECLQFVPPSVRRMGVYCPDSTRWHSLAAVQSLWPGDCRQWNDTDTFPPFDSTLLVTGSLYFIATLRPAFDTLAA